MKQSPYAFILRYGDCFASPLSLISAVSGVARIHGCYFEPPKVPRNFYGSEDSGRFRRNDKRGSAR